jgi:uncharacterized protein (TIGR03435 family)
MRRDEKSIREIFDRSFPVASEEQTDLACERVLNRVNASVVDSSVETAAEADRPYHPRPWWRIVAVGAAAAAFAAIAFVVFPYVRPGVSTDGVYGTVDNGDGSHYRLTAGKMLRTNPGAEAVLTLADGSRIEIRSQSELSLERADDGVRIRLSQGGIIVSAAKQRNGHLYVQTKDVTVSVVGTVFSVNAEEAGSRVAVIQGEVHVELGPTSKRLLPGEQVATNPLMNPHPVLEEFSWSRNAGEHLALLQHAAVPSGVGGSAPAVPMQFEAASVRPSANGRPTRVRCRGTDGELDVVPAGAVVPAVPLGRCTAAGVPLLTLIATAYDLPRDRISGLPGSAETEIYQIEAKAEDPAGTTREQLRQMLQMLLIEQFRLKAHHETKETQGYALFVGKNGIRFNEASGDEENIPAGPPAPGRPLSLKGKYRMKRFAGSLSIFTGFLPVIDKTDLAAVYDLDLALNPVPNPAAGGGRGAGARMEFDPPLAKALEEQLGLRLESRKVPVDYLAVEHVEKPSEPAASTSPVAAAPATPAAQTASASAQFEVSSVKRNDSNSQAITLAPTPST